MPTIVKLARSSQALSDIIKIRSKIYSQVSKISENQVQILDQYDVFPSTVQVGIYSAGKIIGCARACEYVQSSKSHNHDFNFIESQQNLQSQKTALFDVFLIEPTTLESHWIFQAVLKTTLMACHDHEYEYVFISIPKYLYSAIKIIGLKPLVNLDSIKDSEKVACVVSLSEFYHGLSQSILDREIIRFNKLFYYTLFMPGEIVAVEGERGATSFLIEEGEVEVVKIKNDQVLALKSIGPGHLVGEIAMVTNDTRTASIIAKNRTSTLSFDRHEFMNLVYKEPHRSVDMFRLFAKRIYEVNNRLVQTQKAN